MILLPSDDRPQDRQELLHADGFLQDSLDLSGRQGNFRVARDDDDWNSLLLQPINQGVGSLAVSQIDVDDGYVGSALGNQKFGIRYGGSWTGYVRSQCAKQTLDGVTYMP